MGSYNDPINGTDSSIGTQFNEFKYIKKALIEAKKIQVFTQLSSTMDMPKNFGKTMKKYHYIPLLDDENVNDQGIDATGATITDGNVYGSSKDIGTITSKLPSLGENGGRVNRVGYKRKEIEGTMAKFGFFDEYTQESIDFDTDEELEMHKTREMIMGAAEMTEDALQADLLNSAGVIYYGGDATEVAEITGEDGATASLITYADLQKLDIALDENRTPKTTKIITGTRLTDTKVIPSGRIMYIGTELQPMVEAMEDNFGNQAFIGVEHYAAGGTVAEGEIGKVGRFRIVVAPEMLHWAGVGATETDNAGYRATSGKYDVFPMLVVGDESFATIGFQSNGKSKFKMKHVKPGSSESFSAQDPYGEKGFNSVKWYYGFMLLRPERLAVMKTVAPE